MLRNGLERELASATCRAIFDREKACQPELGGHATVASVISALDYRVASYDRRECLLRVLVSLAQTQPRQPLWKQVLLLGLLPELTSIRSRTVNGVMDPDEVDAALWTAFLGVVQRYPLRRKGSIGAGLRFDTRKRFYRVLVGEQDRSQVPERLVGDVAHGVESAELRERSLPDEEQLEAMLMRCTALDRQDRDLIVATDLHGMTIAQYADSRGLGAGDAGARRRAHARLRQRRCRARRRLRAELGSREAILDAAEDRDGFAAIMV